MINPFSFNFRVWDFLTDSWKNPFGEIYDFEEMISSNRFSVNLFSSLYDKNNINVCQNDIVYSLHSNKFFVVEFGEFHDTNKSPNETSIGFFIHDDQETYGFGKDVNGQTDKFVVVGNVFENSIEQLKTDLKKTFELF